MKSITYIISNINKSLGFEWLAEGLDKNKFKVYFILLNPGTSVLEEFLVAKGIFVKRINYCGKKNFLSAMIAVYFFLRKNKPDIVHAHLFDASLLGMIAAKFARIRRRIYTRHHGSMHHFYNHETVKYDNLINRFATDVVALCNTSEKFLTENEKLPLNKICIVPHGFKFQEYENATYERTEVLRKKYNIPSSYPVIGVISRYTHWKGVQHIIPAFKKLLRIYPDALLILANTVGDYRDEIKNLLKEIPERNYCEIPFEEDIFALYKLFDVFVHTPIAAHFEAFGQTYVEALASGIPSVFTLSGIACDFIVNEKNALVVNYENTDAIRDAVIRLLRDKELATRLAEAGKKDVHKLFPLERMIHSLEELYLK